jgi:hypothetical protein
MIPVSDALKEAGRRASAAYMAKVLWEHFAQIGLLVGRVSIQSMKLILVDVLTMTVREWAC